jgi:hypothetical protein
MTTGEQYWEARYEALADQTDQLLDAIRAGEVSDGHHTHNELYAYRMLYNALLFNEWYFHRKYDVHKSKRHSTGEFCFGTEDKEAGWFIVVATLPTGQVSNHYKMEYWDWFHVPERSLPVAYDDHTPDDARDRLQDLLTIKVETCRADRWKGEPSYIGDHAGHFFHYGKDDEYQGYCAGWPKPVGVRF